MSPPPFIDIEASGFGAGSYPIEVGFVLADGQTYCTLIRPEPDWRHWDDSAQGVHGISRDVLHTHGKSPEEVAREVNERLRGQTVFTDSWYHDYNWLSRLFDAAGASPQFKLEDLRALLPGDTADRWHSTKEVVTAELNLSRHRASNDARILQTTLMRVTQA
jgi:hypothetical protein